MVSPAASEVGVLACTIVCEVLGLTAKAVTFCPAITLTVWLLEGAAGRVAVKLATVALWLISKSEAALIVTLVPAVTS